VAGAAAIAVGRDDREWRDAGQRFLQEAQTLGTIAIVIGKQDLQGQATGSRRVGRDRAALYWKAPATWRRRRVLPRMSDDDERELFRKAVRGVRRLRHVRTVPDAPPRQALAVSRRADERSVLAESLMLDATDLEIETGEELAWRRAGVGEATLRRLRRGQFARRAELDLHGMTQAEARLALTEFLAESRALGLQCVRVVHGKGRGSGDRGPVLKAAVNRWLRRTGAVRAFCSARRPDGGTGAVYVLLDP
jgi:DNA-nicking Smr family endonuclease